MALQIPSTSMSLPLQGGGSVTLKGRSRAGDGTTFLLQELKVMFDFGALIQQGSPDVAFLTHTHADHIAFMAQVLTDRIKHTHVYLPSKALPFVQNFLQAHQEMIDCGEEPEDGESTVNYTLHPVDFGDALNLKIKGSNYTITALKCDHRIDCLGFSIFRKIRTLKPEYKDLTGREIGNLHKEGIVAYDYEDKPFLCYLGDTTHVVFENHPEILRQHNYIVVECSFFCDKTHEKARNTKHMHWKDLKPIVEAHPDVLFILIHFSLRYSAVEIRQFFVQETASTRNVHPVLLQNELRQGRGPGAVDGKIPWCNCYLCRDQYRAELQAKGAAADAEMEGDSQSRQSRNSGNWRRGRWNSNNTRIHRGKRAADEEEDNDVEMDQLVDVDDVHHQQQQHHNSKQSHQGGHQRKHRDGKRHQHVRRNGFSQHPPHASGESNKANRHFRNHERNAPKSGEDNVIDLT